jgi:hypothetical protein
MGPRRWRWGCGWVDIEAVIELEGRIEGFVALIGGRVFGLVEFGEV